MKDLVILGAGGLAREVAFLVREINKQKPTWNLLGFVEDTIDKVGEMIGPYTVVFSEDQLRDRAVAVAIGIGTPATLRKISGKLSGFRNLSFPNLIHPDTVWDQDRITIGRGNIITAGNIFTTDLRIGSFNFFNLNCTYGHDVEIADYCVFNPGINLSGSVRVGSGCLVGTGATILQGLNIGSDAIIGAGAVVTREVISGTTVIGVPAKPI